MFLDYTEEQAALRTELRAYFERLLTPEVRAGLGARGRGQPDLPRGREADGCRRLARHRVARSSTGARAAGVIDQFIFFDEVQRAGAPFPFVTINTVGPTLMTYGSEEHKSTYLPGILQRRDQLRHRLHRARGRHRPRVPAHARRPRRRRVGHQRQQGLHQRREPGRLRLARVPHRPRRTEAQGHLDHHRPDVVTRVQDDADRHRRQRRHPGDLLRRHPGAEGQRRRRGQRRMASDHQPAQPRARRPRRARRAQTFRLYDDVRASACREPTPFGVRPDRQGDPSTCRGSAAISPGRTPSSRP